MSHAAFDDRPAYKKWVFDAALGVYKNGEFQDQLYRMSFNDRYCQSPVAYESLIHGFKPTEVHAFVLQRRLLHELYPDVEFELRAAVPANFGLDKSVAWVAVGGNEAQIARWKLDGMRG